jgi:hypothetical protein
MCAPPATCTAAPVTIPTSPSAVSVTQCKRLAEAALTEAAKADYLDMKRRWLSLARSYEFAERPSRFTEPFRKQVSTNSDTDLFTMRG